MYLITVRLSSCVVHRLIRAAAGSSPARTQPVLFHVFFPLSIIGTPVYTRIFMLIVRVPPPRVRICILDQLQ